VVHFEFDGVRIEAREGESVAAALLATGRHGLRRSAKGKAPRGYYCGMGVCWECSVEVEGTGRVRACRLVAEDGLRLRSAVT
jgi:hypothetical protein